MTDAELSAHLLERISLLARSGEQTDGLYPVQWTALRFLSRANRFSRTPAALTRYLNATRGTVSQTLIALEKKGLIVRLPSPRDKRSVVAELTEDGAELLSKDPIGKLANEIEGALGPEAAGLRESLSCLLEQLIRKNNGRHFGQCLDCRHFRKDTGGLPGSPHHCALLDADLSDEDSLQICDEFKAA